MCTHKQMFGGRGGLILIGKDYALPAPNSKFTLAQIIQKKVFPFFQGAPNQSAISAKARGMAFCASDEFKRIAKTIIELSQALAAGFQAKGYRVITGGTDNHIVVVDVMEKGITGVIAEKALEDCGLVVNKNRIPYDQKPPSITSGIRLGTNGLPIRNMTPDDMAECVDLIHEVLTNVKPVDDRAYELDPAFQAEITEKVKAICRRRPISTYPQPQD
jgi:glycine hydroxymethyltransferase